MDQRHSRRKISKIKNRRLSSRELHVGFSFARYVLVRGAREVKAMIAGAREAGVECKEATERLPFVCLVYTQEREKQQLSIQSLEGKLEGMFTVLSH